MSLKTLVGPIGARLIPGDWGCRQDHGDTVNGTGRQAEGTAGAVLRNHLMHKFKGADDGINRTGRYAEGASDAALFIDPCDFYRALYAAARVQGKYGRTREAGEFFDACLSAWGAAINGRLPTRDRLRIGTACRVAATLALCLRQYRVDGRRQKFPGEQALRRLRRQP
jgi:hypothetical protein